MSVSYNNHGRVDNYEVKTLVTVYDSSFSDEKQPLLQQKEKDSESQYPEYVHRQYLAALLCALMSMSTGCMGGWSSAAVPILMSKYSSELGGVGQLSADQASWLTSLMNLGSLVGSIPAGFMAHQIGRKRILLYLAFLLIFSWLCIICNFGYVELIYLGRFMGGVVAGVVCVAVAMYVNEICCDVIRGRSGVFYDLMQVLGILYVYVVSAAFSLRWATFCCTLVPTVAFLTFIWMPESPLYLVKQGRRSQAIDAIKWLHGHNCDIQEHIARIEHTLIEGKAKSKGDVDDPSNHRSSSFSNCITSIKAFFTSLGRTTIKSYFMVLTLFVVQRSCGAPIIVYYAQDVFDFARVNVPSSVATVWLGAFQFLCSVCSLFLVDRLGRRPLLIFSLSAMVVSLCVFIEYLALVDQDPTLKDEYGWIPIASISLFVGLFRLGLGPIPWFMSSELIPTADQKWALSTICLVAWSVAFVCSKTFLLWVEAFGYANVFAIYAIICSIGILHTVYFLPETKNKSRRQIQQELMDGVKSPPPAIAATLMPVIIEN